MTKTPADPMAILAREAAFEQAARTFWEAARWMASSTIDTTEYADRDASEVITLQALQLGIVAMVRTSGGTLTTESFAVALGIAAGTVAAHGTPASAVAMVRVFPEQFGITLAQCMERRPRPTVPDTGNA